MRINTVEEPMKYKEHRGFNEAEHREFNDSSEHSRKQNNDSEIVSFSQVLKEVKRARKYLYSK